MKQRIDHVAEAQRHIDSAHEQQDREGEYEHSVRDNALLAQVHATLALVEQQRIANLIALAAHANERFGNYAGEAGGMGVLFSYGRTDASNVQVRDDIREALGL